MSEWKPGDVGTWSGVPVALCVGTGGPDDMPRFAHQWGGFVTYGGARRLVVIDPEDAEQVERLASAYCRAYDGDLFCRLQPEERESMQAALREFARPTPVKPEEPTGLGAVVEESNGDRYVRAAEGAAGWAKVNSKSRKDSFTLVSWMLLDVTRILSHGVTDA